MPASTDIHRIAMLLTGLGEELAGPALDGLGSARATRVRDELERLSTNPPDPEELNQVLDEFETFMRFALKTAGAPSSWADRYFEEEESAAAAERPGAAPGKPVLQIFQPTDDPILDLQQLQPVQIAGALHNEHPKTIGLVLSSLENEMAADVIDQLPAGLQSQVFLALQQQPSVPAELLDRVARKTVEKAALIEPAEVESRDDDQKTVDLLRALPKPTRNRLMSELEQTNPETASRLQDMLYIFEDLITYDNRSIQKLLGQFDTQVLVVAMQDVEPGISDRIFENLSKRATVALKEEMEFKQSSSAEEVTAARAEIAALIAQLDRSGDLTEL